MARPPSLCGFEPVLVELDIDRVACRAGVVGPHMLLVEAYAVQHLLGLAAAAVCQLLGIAELAADAFDDPPLAADIERRAQVAGRVAALDRDLVAGAEPGGHHAFSPADS